MQKRTFFLLCLAIVLIVLLALTAYDPTRPMVVGTFVSIGQALWFAKESVTQSLFWQQYGFWVGVVGTGIIMVTLTALFYEGKIAIWRYGAKKASDLVASRQPAPAPTPTALGTSPPQPQPQVVAPQQEQTKE